MRWSLWMLLAACGCSLDWSVASGGGTGGATGGVGAGATGGVGAGATGGVGASTNGGSGGTAAETSGGAGGGGGTGAIPPSGGGSTACGADVCLGQPCNSEVACGGGTVSCCPSGQDCATPTSATTAGGKCVPAGCADAADTVSCDGACPDLCPAFGLKCCKGTCQLSC